MRRTTDENRPAWTRRRPGNRGVSLAAIGRALRQDWETSVIALARLGRRRL